MADEDEVSEAKFPDEDMEVVAVEVEGVDGRVVGHVRLAESYGVWGEAAESGGDEVGEEAAVSVGGGAAAVEHEDVDGVVGAGVVVVHPVSVDDEEGVRVWEVVVGHGWLVGSKGVFKWEGGESLPIPAFPRRGGRGFGGSAILRSALDNQTPCS